MRFHLPIFLLLFSLYANAQSNASPGMEMVQLRKVITDRHIEAPLVDNNFSNRVFQLLLEDADPERLYFVQADIDRMHSYADKIDNDLHSASWVFYPVFAEVYEKALRRAASIMENHAAKPFPIQQPENFVSDTSWCVSETELRKKWYCHIKAALLYDMVVAKRGKTAPSEKEFLQTQETSSRKKVHLALMRSVNRILAHTSGFDGYARTLYFNAIAKSFDPHTVYFSPVDMQNFVARLSTEGYYFGFSIRETESAELEVGPLMPGGPAWKSGEVTTGDVIEKVRWDGKDWTEHAGVTEFEFDEKISESNIEFMEFALRKPGGMRKNVRLRKEKLNAEETLVRGFILEGKRRIGYISLPDFYSSWGDGLGSRCATDVAAEILKLRKQNIEGLILDVRYNGGGSLAEAIDMAGIFIDAGPVGIEKLKGKEALTLKDGNRGTVYDGPLLILVNSLSASASEFLAAALQDYRRALIAGTKTYGKATAQEMFSLRPGKPEVDYNQLTAGTWGFVKVTSGKMYRINGKSIQQNGVVPDFVIPDLADAYQLRESDQPFALVADSTNKKTYWQPMAELPLTHLKEKSYNRIAVHSGLKSITAYVDLMAEDSSEPEPLSWVEARDDYEKSQKIYLDLAAAFASSGGAFQVNLHEFGKPRMEMDDYANAINTAWIKNLSQDISLEEGFNIICDYIDTLKKK